ncbi:MAG: quinone-dependent dihydroorotate dehydrogenase [Patescibacteria group bacterium]|nr:quinone-dependent dihydroorotate dehydrogenase [Patescibacteria group bacterium]MDE1945166.1 quinone-dependent dihydroorotate dehydrogenase [Patescibacteria group bacterium]MDE2057853.1 quinone-dependent dihydroorotate dehydrogenase [Patescibacteria group bacterium]
MLYENIVLPWLTAHGRLYRDDECIHEIALGLIQRLEGMPGLMPLLKFVTETVSRAKPRTVFDLSFPTPIGLAAGLDKEGVGLPFWEAIGFGFAEIGTVTPRPQLGNPRPRLFRLDPEEMLINRMGFNSQGIGKVNENVAPLRSHVRMPIGLSLGKNKETPDDRAHEDYEAVLAEGVAMQPDFAVVNVSSPNTPGLRDLQKRSLIRDLLRHIVERRDSELSASDDLSWLPLLVKVAPDLSIQELDDLLDAGIEVGIDGIVIGNTTTSTAMFSQPVTGVYAETGGKSGGDWLFDRTLTLCMHTRRHAPRLSLIHVGGIDSADKAARALDVADLIEVLTGFVFKGPKLIRQIRRAC